MTDLLQRAAQDLELPSERLLVPSEAITVRPEARTPSSPIPARRRLTSRIVAAWSSRRRMERHPSSGSRRTVESDVSPLAAAATRGVALFINR
jgi:hypothetical protein